MGNESSIPSSNASYAGASIDRNDNNNYGGGSTTQQHSRSDEISSLIHFAKSNYETKPDESLSALMQAMTLNSGPEKANEAMRCIQAELERRDAQGGMFSFQYPSANSGHETSSSYFSPNGSQDKLERISKIVQDLLTDRSTYLYQMGQQHILQQAMQDGSSMICPKCKGMIPVRRFQQHEEYWCTASTASFHTEIEENDDDMEL